MRTGQGRLRDFPGPVFWLAWKFATGNASDIEGFDTESLENFLQRHAYSNTFQPLEDEIITRGSELFVTEALNSGNPMAIAQAAKELAYTYQYLNDDLFSKGPTLQVREKRIKLYENLIGIAEGIWRRSENSGS